MSAFSERSAKYAADILWEPRYITVLFMFADITITPLPGGCFIPVCSAAIPADAVNQNSAINFINGMLQDEHTQASRMEQGFSVRKGYHIADYKRFEEDEAGKPSKLNWDLLMSQFSGPAITEKVLQNKLYEQAELLYKGSITIEEAVSDVMQNTKLYFAERQ